MAVKCNTNIFFYQSAVLKNKQSYCSSLKMERAGYPETSVAAFRTAQEVKFRKTVSRFMMLK
jgi:hypothetical protein